VEILFDTLGSERGLATVVRAAVCTHELMGIDLALIGPEDKLSAILATIPNARTYCRIINCSENIEMTENAPEAVEKKKYASVNLAMRELNCGNSDAFISPGHSGATVCAAKNILGLLKPVNRPGLCQILPVAESKKILLTDVGATISVTPVDRLLFAVMSLSVSSMLTGISSPLVGLLNIGAEPNKGNLDLVESYKLFTNKLSNFHGNIEGHDIWAGTVDVVITDGINGNIVLKSSEGLVNLMLKGFKQNHDSALNQHFSPSNYGGAILLGVDGICIVSHAQARVDEIVSATRLAVQCVKNNLVTNVKDKLSSNNISQMEYNKEISP